MKLSRKKVFFLYLNAFSLVSVLDTLFDAVQYHTLLNWVFLAVYAFLFALITAKTRTLLGSVVYEPSRKEYKDKIKKRINNLTYLTVYLLAILFVNLYTAITSTPVKIHEVLTAIKPSIDWLLYALFFWFAAVLILSATCSKEEWDICKKYYLRQGLISAVTWLLYLVVSVIVGIRFLYGTFVRVSGVYLIFVCTCNLTLRKNIVEVNFLWKRRYTITVVSVLSVTLLVSYMRRDTYYLHGYINQLPRLSQNTVPIVYREGDGVYELYMKDDEFKIL